MSRVNHVKKARKDIPGTDIKKGDSYHWWKFKYGVKNCQKAYPTRTQLTQSEFLKSVYDISDRIMKEITYGMERDDIRGVIDDIISDIQSLSEEQEEKLQNMPEQLQSSSVGELLQSRIDSCNDWVSMFEDILSHLDDDETDIEEIVDEIHGCDYEGD